MTAPLRSTTPGRARHGAEFLTELLDFEGAVQLAQTLDGAPLARLAPPASAEALALARHRLATAEHEARQPLRDPRTGGPLLSAAQLAQALDDAGVPATRQRRAIAGAARALFGPVEARTLRRVVSVRELVAEVRRDLAPTIAARAPRLEQLDAALDDATRARADALFARAVAAIADAFAAALEQAVLALPKACDDATLAAERAAWLAERGVVAEHLARSEALVVAAFLHERARLDVLVRNTLGERLA